MLPWKDSNSHKRNQNPVCYHYTTRQNWEIAILLQLSTCFPFDDAKLVFYFESAKLFTIKFTYKIFLIKFTYKIWWIQNYLLILQ